jgi:peptide/nickel transport system substrate-binding protein
MKAVHTRSAGVLLALVALALVVGGLIWGLAASFGASGSPVPSSGPLVLRIGITSMPDNLNPLIGYEQASYEVWNLNYDLLFDYAPDGSTRAGVIQSWSHSADGLTWTLKVRPGVKWQDGQPLTAKDVAWTLNMLVKDNVATYAQLTKFITDAVAVDDATCEVHCSKPKADMTRAFVYVLPEHIWSKFPNPQKVKMTYPIVGSGPFQCTQYKQGQFVELKKNSGYWGQTPAIDSVILQGYTNEDTMLQDFKLGVIDAAYGVPAAQYPSVSNQSGVQGFKGNIYYAEYIDFNCYDSKYSQGNPVLKDVKFRQALMWAVDRQECVKIGLGGYGTVGDTWIMPGEWGNGWDPHYTPTADEAYGFDIGKAGQLLTDAGYPLKNGQRLDKSGKPITLRVWARSESTSCQKELKLIAGWWQQLGLKISFEVMDNGVLSDRLYSYTASGEYAPNFDVYQWDSYGYADPGDNLNSFMTEQIQNWNDANWSDPQYDALAAQQTSELDQTKRTEIIKQMQKMLYDNVVDFPFTYPYILTVANVKKWDGWVPYIGAAPVMNGFNIDTYTNLRPKSAGSSGGGSTTTTLIIAGVAVVVVAIVAIVLLGRRRKVQVVEE